MSCALLHLAYGTRLLDGPACRSPRPHVASLDEVPITRDGDAAIIQYADPRIGTTHFTLAAGLVAKLTDAQILELWNEQLSRFPTTRKPMRCIWPEVRS